MPMGLMSLMERSLNNSWTIIWSDCSRKRRADEELIVKAEKPGHRPALCLRPSCLILRSRLRESGAISGTVQGAVASGAPPGEATTEAPGRYRSLYRTAAVNATQAHQVALLWVANAPPYRTGDRATFPYTQLQTDLSGGQTGRGFRLHFGAKIG